MTLVEVGVRIGVGTQAVRPHTGRVWRCLSRGRRLQPDGAGTVAPGGSIVGDLREHERLALFGMDFAPLVIVGSSTRGCAPG